MRSWKKPGQLKKSSTSCSCKTSALKVQIACRHRSKVANVNTYRTPKSLPGNFLPGRNAQLLVLLSLVSLLSAAQELPSLDIMAGKGLFEKNWVSAPASTAASDGLGPFFNARSCVACHQGGGRGAVPEALNFVTADAAYGALLQTHAVQGLRAEARVKISAHEQIALFEDGTKVVMHTPDYELTDARYGVLAKPLSARIAPSLAGLQLLAQVPEHYLQAAADPEDSDGDGISGRVSKVPELATGALVTGRFGWKAESDSLRTQIAKAFILDMGLGTSLFPSSFGDCTEYQPDCLQMAQGNSPAMTDPEVSDTILELLLVYLQSLVPEQQEVVMANLQTATRLDPAVRSGGDKIILEYAEHIPAEGAVVNSGPTLTGLDLFVNSGCSACHSPSLPAGDTSISPFTDLLLHDMGPGLAAETTEFTQGAEWRTAPLWGLSSTRFYLHDGRATTLSEAILWHGGEGASSVEAYRQLPGVERDVLHSWLLGL
jgi:CxxC motif-containing protein (DUF1111 family)